jgi:hypothetical protein
MRIHSCVSLGQDRGKEETLEKNQTEWLVAQCSLTSAANRTSMRRLRGVPTKTFTVNTGQSSNNNKAVLTG